VREELLAKLGGELAPPYPVRARRRFYMARVSLLVWLVALWNKVPFRQSICPFLIVLAAFHPTGYAAEEEQDGQISFSLGLEYEYFYYSETDAFGYEVMNITGGLPGIRGSVSQFSKVFWCLEGRYSSGDLAYDGQTQAGQPLTMETENSIGELRFMIGPTLEQDEGKLAIYSGLVFRQWINDSPPPGYKRDISQLYLPIGLQMVRPIGEDATFVGNLELDVLLSGTVSSSFSDLDPTFGDAENKQKAGTGIAFRASADFRFPLSDSVNMSIGPFLRYIYVAESETDTVDLGGVPAEVVEPENETLEAGLALSLVW